MKTNLKLGLVAVLGVSVLFAAIVTGGPSFVDGLDLLSSGEDVAENITDNGNSSGDYVYPGIGFEDKESSETFIAAYGIRPSEEMRTDEWSDRLSEVKDSLVKDFQETGKGSNVTFNDIKESVIKESLETSEKPTMAQIREAYIAHGIDISSSLVKYVLGGENNTLIYNLGAGDGAIHVGLNMDENVNESQREEIYDLFYQRGKELGINDTPVFFFSSGPLTFS
jgi:hypothetical protein